MKKLYKLILRSYVGPFVLTFFIALFVLLMQFLWKYIDDMVGKGIDFMVLMELLVYWSASLVPTALPLAVLLSSLMTFGNLGEKYELVAMKSAGISFQESMRPLLFFSIFLSLAAFSFSNYVMPVAFLKARNLLYDVQRAKPVVSIPEGVFYNDIENLSLKIGSKDKDGKTVHDIILYDKTSNKGNNNVTFAEWGTIALSEDEQSLIMTLYNGTNYYESLDKREHYDSRPMQRTHFKEEERVIDLSSFSFEKSDNSVFKNHYAMMNTKQLRNAIDSLETSLDKKTVETLNYLHRTYLYYGLANDTAKNKAQNIPDGKSIIDSVHFQKNMDSLRRLQRINILKEQIKKDRISQIDIEGNNPHITYNPNKKNLCDSTDLLCNFSKADKIAIIEHALSQTRGIENHFTFRKTNFRNQQSYIARHEVEYYRKYTLAIACIVLFLIGAPLGAIIRKGGLGFPLVASIIMFLIYHVISIMGEKLAKDLSIEPILGMWLSTIILLPTGVFLTYKASTDSAIFDSESWTKAFHNLFNLNKKKKQKKIIKKAVN